jgi:hypothetical protein
MADYNTIQWPSHSTKCIIQESGQDGRTMFVDRDIWIKMTNKHKKVCEVYFIFIFILESVHKQDKYALTSASVHHIRYNTLSKNR